MNLKEIRKSKRYEQKQFAELIGISVSVYNRIENGKLENIKPEYINKISIGLELTNEEVINLFEIEDYLTKCIRVLKDIKQNGQAS